MSGSDPIVPSSTVAPTVAPVLQHRMLRWWPALPLLIIAALLSLRAVVVSPPTSRLRPSASLPLDPAGTVALEGSVFLPRGGPYLLGFESVGSARLTVGTHVISGNNAGKDRVILPPGATALRLVAAPGARLLWSPPGRRGDMEYLPASSLSPQPPATARFTHAGTAYFDGVIAVSLLSVIIAATLFAARRRLRRVTRRQGLSLAAVFAVALAVRLYDAGAAGQTWDEDANWAAGRNYITNVVSLDFRHAAWQANYEHPPMMKYLMGIGAQFADGYGPARAMAALLVAVSCVLLVPLLARLFRWQVGVAAGVFAALTPTLIAHGKVVGHEAPTLLWWTLGLLLSVTAFDHLPDQPHAAARLLRQRLLVLGLVLGLAIASRFVNVFLGPLMGTILVLGAPPALRKSVLVWGATILPVVALITLVVVWPRLWSGPFSQLAESWNKLKKPHSIEPFLGTFTNTPSPMYFVVYLLVTMPLGLLLATLLGAGVRLRCWQRRATLANGTPAAAASADIIRRRAGLILVAWLLIPLGVMASPVRQDGVRYVMPCILALLGFAAVGVDALGQWLQPRWRLATFALATVMAGYLALVCLRIHPYYLDYFGEHVGGPQHVAAHDWFETAWWGEGVDRAVHYVNTHAGPNARVYRDCIEPVHLAWFRGDLWAPMVNIPEAADWIVVYSPSSKSCAVPATARLVFEVRAAGAPLAQVFHIVKP
ncbi:MAG: glycosyltransferase family 39 protein [Kofleriaceae bacterium]|nr:glycosyltransferase family 39 protein [Kofleriaceae bacterium]